MNINWNIPEIRSGLGGQIDKIIGPGATKSEKNIQLYILFGVAAILGLLAIMQNWGWSLGQIIVALLITVDMTGGVITNATSTAKRWYFREGQGFKEHISFISIHFMQLALISYFFLDFDILWIVLTGGYMMLACTIILKAPLYLQRPISFSLYGLSLILSLYVFKAPEYLEWFLPLFYLKLLISHCLREEPYRPEAE